MQFRQFKLKPSTLALAAAAALGPFAATPASAAVCAWNTTAGNWAALVNWAACVAGNGNPVGTPGSADTANIGAPGVVTVNTAQSILNLNNAGRIDIDAASLTLQGGGATNNSGGVINIANGASLNQMGQTITGGTINATGTGRMVANASSSNILSGVTLNGLLDMATAQGIQRIFNGLTLGGTISVNNNSVLAFEGTNTVSGGGTIVLGGTGLNNRIGLDGTGTTTFTAGTTIRGQNGTIGNAVFVGGGGAQALVNNGTISADVAGGTINITGAAVTNNGTLSALNGGTLLLSSNVSGGAAGQILAGAGSTVLQSAVTLSGVVNTSGGGRFAASASVNNFLNGVTLNGNLDLATATGIERVTAGGLVLNGTINLNSNSVLAFNGTGGLSGAGTIVLGSTGSSNRIGLDGSGTTTFAAGTTIRGQNGTIGNAVFGGGGQTLVNNGTISADVSGGTINIAGAAVTNNGTLSALNGGTLLLSSNVSGGAAGQILAGAGSTVLQNGVTLTGVVNTSGGGRFAASASFGNILNGVTLNGNLDLATATGFERVTAGGLVLNGTINLNNNSVLAFSETGGLSGVGTIVLGNTGQFNRIGLDGFGTTTFAAGTTIRGQNGTIGNAAFVGGAQTLVNNGTISADVVGGTINIASAAVTNNGTLSALNGGTLLLSSNVSGSAAGQIVTGAGSTVLQSAVTLSGVINTSGSGRFAANASGSNILNGVTLNGNLDLATATGFERVTAGGLVLNGTINLNNNSVLAFNDTGELSGAGTIVLGNTGGSNRIALDGNGITTFAAGTTIRGQNGTIGSAVFVGGAQTLVNNGTINADVAGGLITITGAPLVNNGLVRAQAGTMTVSTALSGTGTLQVDAAGAMNLAAGAKSQGTLAMGAAGAALNLNTGNLTINSDYTNVGAGSGNSFNRRAGVTGTGQIVAGGNVSQVITGAGVTNGTTSNATLIVGNMRVGANTFNVQIGNTGTTGPTLRGAIQTNVNGGNITDARLSGTAVTASNYNAGAPGVDSGNLGVTFTAASAGILAPLTGQTVNLRSNFENIADQRLNIAMGAGAAAFNAAVGSTVTPVQVANQRVGGSNSATLSITNTAVAGAFSEDLNASIASFSGQATASGSVSGRLAGTNNTGTGATTVGVSTAAAGAQTGTVNLNYQTAGTVGGVSNGLGTAAAGGQAVSVNGNVYQLAAGAIQTAPLNFGTLQVGQQVSQNLVVRNTAAGSAGFVEDLNATFGASGNSQISGSGALSGILAGTNSSGANGAMIVTVTGATAGALVSSIAVNYNSAGAVNGVSNGLGTFGVGTDNYGVNGVIQAGGNVINQASALVNNPTINLGAVRVGAAAPSGTVSVTNVASAPPQAALNAAMGATSGPATASGSFNLLAPGATNNSSLLVGLNTGTAGNFTGGNAGTATINFVSDANNVGNCAPNCQLNLAAQTVNVEGKVYTQAVGSVSGTAINFGVVRVGDTVSAANITISNTAASTALNDTLRADLSGVGGPFSAPGSVAGVAAQSTAQLAVGLNTATAGVFSQSGTLGFLSQNADMADVSAGANATVSLMAQVNNLANADFDLQAGTGTLSQTGTRYVLDLGTIVLGDSVSTVLRLDNDVTSPADALSGLFDLIGADDFSYSGWNPLAFLAAGQASGTLNVNWLAGSLGLFSDTIVFNGFGTNASDALGLAQTRQLTIRANVINGVPPGTVPEPGTLALLLGAAAAAGLARRRACAQGRAPEAAR